MTKSELIEELAKRMKITKSRAEAVVNRVFESMADALERGEGVEIRGFGSFTIRERGGYAGRNPQTGVEVQVHPKRVPWFTVGKELRQWVSNTQLAREAMHDDDDDDDELDELDELPPREARQPGDTGEKGCCVDEVGAPARRPRRR